jgi:hypothetical protein
MSADFFLISWIRALVLLLITHNPLGWSYIGWVTSPSPPPGALVFFGGALLFLGYWFFFRLALKSVKASGILVAIVMAFVAVVALAELSLEHSYINNIHAGWILIFIGSITMAATVGMRTP